MKKKIKNPIYFSSEELKELSYAISEFISTYESAGINMEEKQKELILSIVKKIRKERQLRNA